MSARRTLARDAARQRVREFLDARRVIQGDNPKLRGGLDPDIIISVGAIEGPLHLTVTDLELLLKEGE